MITRTANTDKVQLLTEAQMYEKYTTKSEKYDWAMGLTYIKWIKYKKCLIELTGFAIKYL